MTNSGGGIEAEQNFDAWGRRRDKDSWALLAPTASTCLPVWLYRGYTGHEHIDQFGLINMNGRLYDPVLGRMLSPDNYVQLPDNTQSFNRYSYVINNPLKYIDPSGQTWLGQFKNWVSEQSPVLRSTVFLPTMYTLNPALAVIDASTLGGYISGFIQGGFDMGKNKVKNFNQLLGGQFKGSAKQIASRHLWEPLQNTFGLGFGILYNNIDPDINVDYFEGATVVRGSTIFHDDAAVTIGSYISGNREDIRTPFLGNNLFLHEYGHYLQSQKSGPLWMNKYALSSLISANGSGNHNNLWVERDANGRSFDHFGSRIMIGRRWDFLEFPLGNIRSNKWWEPLMFIFDPLAITRYYK